MNGLLAMSDDEVRLYSTKRRAPVDVIAEQHRPIHDWLERWGAWQRGSSAGPATCSSLEGNFDAGGRDTKRPTVTLPPNPVFPRITRAILVMPLQHAETLRLFYGRRRSPMVICSVMVLRWEDFAVWMFDCRSMVRNVLRRDGLVLDGEAP